MGKQVDSPVVSLMRNVWKNGQAATSHSWERLNHSMRAALRLAIGAGYEFVCGDFASLDEFRPGYWMGPDSEWVYSLAVAEGNVSAAKEYESWRNREPIIADNVRVAAQHNGLLAHAAGERQSERLHVGCYFLWQGERVKVTSFTEQGSAVAVLYHPGTPGKYDSERRVKRRFCITREAVIQDRADRKERAAIERRLYAVVEAGSLKAGDVLKRLGVKTKDEFARLPLPRLRKAAGAVLETVKGA